MRPEGAAGEPLGPVLIFDSGVGGLSVLARVGRLRPDLRFLYLGDNARFPYGDLADEVIVERVVTLLSAAVSRYRPALVVVACNTASTLALPMLRSRIQVPIVGVVPAIKPAAALTRNGRIGLLATPATVRRSYLDSLIADHAPAASVLRVGSSALVREAEGLLQGGTPEPDILAYALAPLAEAEVDTVVLGCTHFPLIGGQLRDRLPGVDYWVDSGDAIARRVDQILTEMDVDSTVSPTEPGPEIQLMFTGVVPAGVPGYLRACGFAGPLRQTDFESAPV